MRNMVTKLGSSKALSWVKKNWFKVILTIVVIYAIYWLFIEDPDTEHFKQKDLKKVKEMRDESKRIYDEAQKAEDDAINGIIQPNCDNSTNIFRSSTTPGCSDYTTMARLSYELMNALYEEAEKEYKKSQKSQKKKKSPSNRARRFFGLK